MHGPSLKRSGKNQRFSVAVALLLSACNGYEIRHIGPVEYGIIPGGIPVFILGTDIHDDLTDSAAIGPFAPELEKAGFSVVALDLPCHGKDGYGGLDCWRARIQGGDDLFAAFCPRISAILDALESPAAGIVGVSRGGYAALVCAAHEPRLSALALIAPVTDLSRLTEFQDMPPIPAPTLSRPMLVRIGRHDDRVGTDLAVAYAKAAGADLQLLDTQGHIAPEDGSTIRWITAHLTPH